MPHSREFANSPETLDSLSAKMSEKQGSMTDQCQAEPDRRGRDVAGLRTHLLLRGQHVANSSQGQRVAGDSKAGHDALADRGSLRGGAATDRVGDVYLGCRELDLREGGHERR